MADIVWADVVEIAPLLGTPLVPFQTVILDYVNDNVLVGTEAGDKTNLARRYLAAHMTELSLAGSSVSGGSISREKVDDLEREYSGTTLVGTDPNLDSTTYGKMYKFIVRNSVARFMVL